MTDSPEDTSTPRHRARTTAGARDALVLVDAPATALDEGRRRRLRSLRERAVAQGDVVVAADPEADVEITAGGRDVFEANPGLVQDLRRRGVKRLTVAGDDAGRTAATCQAGRHAGFTVDLASLTGTRGDAEAPAPGLFDTADDELLPGAPEGSAPSGAASPGTIEDEAIEPLAWDDTWALRGDRSPADQADTGHGVRGWINRRIRDVRERQANPNRREH